MTSTRSCSYLYISPLVTLQGDDVFVERRGGIWFMMKAFGIDVSLSTKNHDSTDSEFERMGDVREGVGKKGGRVVRGAPLHRTESNAL